MASWMKIGTLMDVERGGGAEGRAGGWAVSEDSSISPEPEPAICMEPFLVRRRSSRTVQLPPLAFRQAEQYYLDRKQESDTVTVPPRPTTLPLRIPPLIAITSADTSRFDCLHNENTLTIKGRKTNGL
ncbi:hypothetical protein JOB18_043504 [Solea senegalensis]|uniref:Uncharacterized protein n=1 Tax=Solea senegalensis TaxID=28829 RepID=A0AAV6QM76_SOLSE|nr:hypothetical protein JOB18_043504 [Solea senegalensis]